MMICFSAAVVEMQQTVFDMIDRMPEHLFIFCWSLDLCLKQKHLFPFPRGNVAQEACIVARSHCKNGYNRKDRLFGQSNVSLQRSSRWKKNFFFVNDVDVNKNSNNGLLHDDCTYLCIGLIAWCMSFCLWYLNMFIYVHIVHLYLFQSHIFTFWYIQIFILFYFLAMCSATKFAKFANQKKTSNLRNFLLNSQAWQFGTEVGGSVWSS